MTPHEATANEDMAATAELVAAAEANRPRMPKKRQVELTKIAKRFRSGQLIDEWDRRYLDRLAHNFVAQTPEDAALIQRVEAILARLPKSHYSSVRSDVHRYRGSDTGLDEYARKSLQNFVAEREAKDAPARPLRPEDFSAEELAEIVSIAGHWKSFQSGKVRSTESNGIATDGKNVTGVYGDPRKALQLISNWHSGDVRRAQVMAVRKELKVYEVARAYRLPKYRPGTTCGCCGKALSDPASRQRGIGPECWSGIIKHCERIAKEEAGLTIRDSCDIALAELNDASMERIERMKAAAEARRLEKKASHERHTDHIITQFTTEKTT